MSCGAGLRVLELSVKLWDTWQGGRPPSPCPFVEHGGRVHGTWVLGPFRGDIRAAQRFCSCGWVGMESGEVWPARTLILGYPPAARPDPDGRPDLDVPVLFCLVFLQVSLP